MGLEHLSANWDTSLDPRYWPPSNASTAESRTRDRDCECNHTLWRPTFPSPSAAAIGSICASIVAEGFSDILLHLIYAAITNYSFSRAKES